MKTNTLAATTMQIATNFQIIAAAEEMSATIKAKDRVLEEQPWADLIYQHPGSIHNKT